MRSEGDEPIITASTEAGFAHDLAEAVHRESAAVGSGNIAIIAAGSMVASIEAALAAEGVVFGRAQRGNLNEQVTVVPVTLAKGLELDGCIVVEPAEILESEHRGAQALYVALTRATRRLTVLHARPLPEILRSGD